MTSDCASRRCVATPNATKLSEVSERELLSAQLDRAALRYLERFDSSVSNLKRVLQRKARTFDEAQDTAPGLVTECVEELLTRYQSSGLVDDGRYATAVIRGLRGRGLGERAIVQRLRAKGVQPDVIQRSLSSVDEAVGAPELEAALRFVKRRRLGIHRAGESTATTRRRDLQALARAGFSYETARQALGVTMHEDVEAF